MTDDIADGPDAPTGAQTRLDAAFLRAQVAGAPHDAEAQFYDAFLAETLYVPIWEDPQEIDTDDTDEALSPKLFMLEGVETFVAFDTEARLAEFIEEPTNYVGLPGRTLIDMLAGREAQLALNIGVAPSSTVLPAEVVAWLREAIETPIETVEMTGEGGVLVAAPGALPQNLIAGLATRIAEHHPHVEQAWIFLARAAEGEMAHLVLGLAMRAGSEAREAAIAGALGLAAQSYMPPGMHIDVGALPRGSHLLDLARAHGTAVPPDE